MGVPVQYFVGGKGLVWKVGFGFASTTQNSSPVWASVSSLGPWEGPGEIQSLILPKISRDCGLALSQGTSFSSLLPSTITPPPKNTFVLLKAPETFVGTVTTNRSAEKREEAQKQPEAIGASFPPCTGFFFPQQLGPKPAGKFAT